MIDAFLVSKKGSLIGRDKGLAQLKERLFAGKNLVLTALNGLPGVGKTTLAVH
jgi:MoxR-like ATPase